MKILETIKPIEFNTQLNPKLWQDLTLKPEVRDKLLSIAEDFIEFIDVPIQVLDIRIYGANANYYYTKFSDLDLHIVADKTNIPCDREIDELFDSKRRLYNKKYQITIHDIPVELYLENPQDTPVSAAYSLLKNKWIKQPQLTTKTYDKETLNKSVQAWQKMLQTTAATHDLDLIRRAIQLLRIYRRQGLKSKQAELSIPNLTFKQLRNNQTITKITDLIDKLHDKQLSLK